MKQITGWLAVVAVMLVGALLPFQAAHAYLDPGSGSFIIQALIAAGLGALLSVRIFWTRIRGKFGNTVSDDEDEDIDQSDGGGFE